MDTMWVESAVGSTGLDLVAAGERKRESLWMSDTLQRSSEYRLHMRLVSSKKQKMRLNRVVLATRTLASSATRRMERVDATEETSEEEVRKAANISYNDLLHRRTCYPYRTLD